MLVPAADPRDLLCAQEAGDDSDSAPTARRSADPPDPARLSAMLTDYQRLLARRGAEVGHLLGLAARAPGSTNPEVVTLISAVAASVAKGLDSADALTRWVVGDSLVEGDANFPGGRGDRQPVELG
ncbi:MAG: hypothetical protein ACT4OS_06930 [Acidimicrobiales bacterium]